MQNPVMGATVEDVIPVLPAGIYPATFEGIEQAQNDSGTFWLWHFRAKNGDEYVEITATSSPRITPRTKASKWLAGMGVAIEVGQDIDFQALDGMPIQIVVIVNEMGYSRVESVLPFPTSGKAK